MKWSTTRLSIDEGLDAGEIKLILSGSDEVGAEYLSSLSHTKRFLERWTADPVFRKLVKDAPAQVSKDYGLVADPDEIRLLWDCSALNEQTQETSVPLAVRRYQSFIREKLSYRDTLRDNAHPVNKAFKAWRARQINRCFSELGTFKAEAIVHAPVVFEVSKGCSVGCWFCGVSAQRLEQNYAYTEENATLWKGVLAVMSEFVGPAASKGFCYWASDPMDNEDYIKFLQDYHAILGNVPQTTTALPLRDPSKIRDVLQFSEDENGELNRFSILTIKQLDKVHEEYTAEELLLVELVTQNKGALTAKAVSGRARDTRNAKKIAELYITDDPVLTSTISCVSGFLVNMVEKSVRLISPCNSSDKWPLGYRIHDQAEFVDINDFRSAIEKISNRNMSLGLETSSLVCFRDDLTYKNDDNGFFLKNSVVCHTYKDNLTVAEIGEYIAGSDDDLTVADVAISLYENKGIDMSESIFYINQLYKEGIFTDEPSWRKSPGVENEYAGENDLTIIEECN